MISDKKLPVWLRIKDFAIEQDVNLCVSLIFAVSITIGRCIGKIYNMFNRIYSRPELERLQKKANQNINKKQRHFINWQYFQNFPKKY